MKTNEVALSHKRSICIFTEILGTTLTAPPPKVFMDWPRVPLETRGMPLMPMVNNPEANVPTLIL